MIYAIRRTQARQAAMEWVLLANAARARLFERDPENDALRELADFVHPQSRVRRQDLGGKRPGHAFKSQAATAYAPHTDPHERELDRFARYLAHHLEEAALAERMPGLVLIASSPFLGTLKEHLGRAASMRLKAQVARDLTPWRGPELERRVAQALEASVEG